MTGVQPELPVVDTSSSCPHPHPHPFIFLLSDRQEAKIKPRSLLTGRGNPTAGNPPVVMADLRSLLKDQTGVCFFLHFNPQSLYQSSFQNITFKLSFPHSGHFDVTSHWEAQTLAEVTSFNLTCKNIENVKFF